jgi:hypothetical protein
MKQIILLLALFLGFAIEIDAEAAAPQTPPTTQSAYFLAR